MLETKIDELIVAIGNLIAALQSTAPVMPVPANGIVKISAEDPVPVPAPAPVPAPQMPSPPTFEAPAPAPAPMVAPFADQKGLIDYVMSSYKALGAAKGAQIQNVLASLGCQSINQVKPEQYAALYQGVEKLKG